MTSIRSGICIVIIRKIILVLLLIRIAITRTIRILRNLTSITTLLLMNLTSRIRLSLTIICLRRGICRSSERYMYRSETCDDACETKPYASSN